MTLATRLAGALAGSALTLGVLAAAPAVAAGDPVEPTEPCATQQQKVDDAQAALDRVTAVFQRRQEKVAQAKRQKEKADTPREERAAERALERAKDRRDEARKDKKAQKQRLARAEERLEECQAAQG